MEEVTRIPRRSGRKPTIRRSVESKIIETTLHEPPTHGRRWTTRLLAQTLGVSRAMVHRVWREAGITPPEAESGPRERRVDPTVNGAPVSGLAVCGAH